MCCWRGGRGGRPRIGWRRESFVCPPFPQNTSFYLPPNRRKSKRIPQPRRRKPTPWREPAPCRQLLHHSRLRRSRSRVRALGPPLGWSQHAPYRQAQQGDARRLEYGMIKTAIRVLGERSRRLFWMGRGGWIGIKLFYTTHSSHSSRGGATKLLSILLVDKPAYTHDVALVVQPASPLPYPPRSPVIDLPCCLFGSTSFQSFHPQFHPPRAG
jgi:hypothetical protein